MLFVIVELWIKIL